MKQYTIVIDGTAEPWGVRLQADINRVLDQIAKDIRTPTILKAALPTDGSVTTAIVPNESGGPTLAFLYGGVWRRCSDNAVVT